MAGTYWLTILPDTSKLKPAIEAAMRGQKIRADFDVDKKKAEKAGSDAAKAAEAGANKNSPKVKVKADAASASQAGSDAGRRVSSAFDKSADGERVGKQFGGKMASGLKSSLAVLGPLTAGLSLFGGMKSAISEGMDFTTALNTMGGVTKATGDQLKQVSDIARQLGSDVSLPGVSATTAAQAMTELAKGGFDVQQSMDAARGTLQLAGAAGIDAASAATIQADALHAFGLTAKDAGYAADVLANVANASTGEITDFAAGFQQAGAVASQFGLTIDDTAAALGTLANQGIKGSDAGTLLKSALLAITDQGNPAQGAIEELGLKLYDAEGRFVGVRSMMDQLGQAAARMSPEAYQAATNILYGSDAARLAGVAAKDGAKGFDVLKEAVNRQGGAADMAAARTRGLPGAWANFTNTLDNVKLSIYDMVQGPLTGLLNGLTKVPDFITRNSDAFKIAAGVITTVLLPAITMWTVAQAKSVAVSMISGIDSIINGWKVMASGIYNAALALGKFNIVQKIATAAQWLWNAALTANPIGLIVAGLVAVGVALWAFFTKTETGRVLWAKIWGGIKAAASAVWDWMKGALSTLGNVISGIWNFIQPAVMAFARFGAAILKLNFTIAITAIKLLGQAISWLWQNIAVPAFQAIGAVFSTFWNAAKVVWDAFLGAVQWVGDKIGWLWQNIAVPAFNAIKDAISTMWNVVKPIWDLLVAAFDKVSEKVGQIKDKFVDAFNSIKDIVTNVWNSIGGIFDKITNGIGKVTDWVASLGGNSGGGIAGRAGGGLIITGYTEGGMISGPGTGKSDSILGFPAMVRVSNGEYIMNAASTRRYLPLLNALNAGSLPGFAAGGLTPHATQMKSLISQMFGITNIGGYREPDGYNEHSTGNALDVMIPNAQSKEGINLGNSVLAWALKNAKAIGLTGAIWRQTSYGYGNGFDANGKPMEDRGNPTANHFDHVHLFMNEKPDTSLSLSGAPSLVGSATSASGGSYRSATDSELSASSARVDSANNAVTQAQQRVDDKTYNRDRAKERLDAAKAAGKDSRDEEEMLRRAERELTDANTNLAEKRQKAADIEAADTELRTKGKLVTDRSSGSSSDGSGKSGMDGSDLGKTFVSGIMESIGLDGSLFSNPMEWPTVKSAMAGVNWLGGLLSGKNSDMGDGTTNGVSTVGGFASGAADAVGLGGLLSAIPSASAVMASDVQSGSPALAPGEFNPAIAGGTATATPSGMSTFTPADQAGGGQAGGPAVDQSININGNVGMDPAALQTTLRNENNARVRSYQPVRAG